MPAGRRNVLGTKKVSVRVLFSEEDFLELEKIARLERTDVGSLIRRAVARYFLIPDEENSPDRRAVGRYFLVPDDGNPLGRKR